MNRKIWENMLSLYSVHALNYIVPLFTLPYLAHVLGPADWGKLAFAEAYASYVSLVVEYGFGLSATREIAQSRDDDAGRASQLAGVLGAQAFLASGVLLVTWLATYTLPGLLTYRSLLPIAFVMAVTRAITPIWYFQGLERMRTVSLLNIGANVAAAAGIFALVHTPKDIWVPLGLRAAAAVFSTGIALALAYREIPFKLPRLSCARLALTGGGSLFLFKSAVSLYTTANVLLVGLIAPPNAVAWFAGAEKIVKAGVGAISPLTQTFYPRISYLLKADPERAKDTARWSVCLTIGVGLAMGLFMLIAAPLLVRLLLGPGFERSIPVLRLFSALPPLIATSIVLGVQWMLPLRLDWVYSRIVVTAGLVNLILAVLLTPRYQQMGMAASVIAAELFVTFAVVFVLRRRRLDPWSTPRAEAPAVLAEMAAAS